MTSPPLPIRTERLLLRTARPDDLDAVASYWGDPEVTRYLPFDALDRTAAFVRLARLVQSIDPVAAEEALFLLCELDGAVVGDVMLRLKAGDPVGVAELGWVFSPDVAGRGLATEAARAVADIAFTHYDVHRVEAQLDPANERSVALCLRLGMVEEAHLRRDFPKGGVWSDTGVYGLLREEWEARR